MDISEFHDDSLSSQIIYLINYDSVVLKTVNSSGHTEDRKLATELYLP